MPFDLQLTEPSPLSPLTLAANLLIGAVLSFVLGWHFVRFGRTMSNRAVFAHMLPFIALTTILVISVVKSSLALSLGLVGALSIVRFRTPIKEPEELAYIFMAIAIGLGLGADQRVPVVTASVLILAVMAIRSTMSSRKRKPNLYLNVECSANGDGGERFRRLTSLVASKVHTTDIRRVDLRDGLMQATYYVDCTDEGQLTELIQSLKQDMPDAAISFVDQNNL